MAWLVNALLEVIKDLVYGAFVLITKWFTGTLTLSTGEFHDIFNKGEEMNLLDLLVDDVIGPLAVAGGDRYHGISVVPFHVCKEGTGGSR